MSAQEYNKLLKLRTGELSELEPHILIALINHRRDSWYRTPLQRILNRRLLLA